MIRSFRIIAVGLVILGLAGLACTLTGQAQPTLDPAGIAERARQTLESGSAPIETTITPTSLPSETPTPTLTPTESPTAFPSLPIGLRQGLASLNSYRMVTKIFIDGPDPLDINHQTTTTMVDVEQDRSYIRSEALISSVDDPSTETKINEQYRSGLVVCNLPVEEDEPPLKDILPIQKEMNDTLLGLTDFTIYVADPVLVGEEQVNGVATRHFQFTVTGLGKTSGAEVTQSTGEYWTAIDGNYLVKYNLTLETRTAPAGNPEAKVMRAEIRMELSEINQPVSIEMPPECK